MSFNTITYLSHCHGLRRNTVTWFTLAIKTCLKTVLPRDTLLQITLLRGYIQLNEQPVVSMPYMCCSFAGYWWFYIYRACAETSIGTFITPGKCKRYNVPHFRCYLFATHTLSRETALITLFMTWLLPNISTFYICLYSAKKVVPRVTCQHCRKLRSCVVFRTPRVGYGRSFVRSISLAIITFSAIKHDHILWQLCFFHCGLF